MNMNNNLLQINELTTILNKHFHWNKARMSCFVGMLIALLILVQSAGYTYYIF